MLQPILIQAQETTIPAEAQDLCPSTIISGPEIKASTGPDDGSTHLSAQEAIIDNENVTIFRGDAIATQGSKQISADMLRYERSTELFTAEGNLVYQNKGIVVSSDRGEFNLQSNQGELEQAKYSTKTSNGRGTADMIVIKNNHEAELNNAIYTTCPEGQVDWQLNAESISLDTESHQGTASNVVLEFMDVPIFYLPYIRFPIGDQRLSGFLFPGFSSSDELGTEISIPYYWNIAENMDATITPRFLSKRGTMLDTEFRYLGKSGYGKMSLIHLPDDKIFKDDRTRLNWEHHSNLSKGWSSNVEYNYVSDKEYADDFSGSLGITSITHLERRGDLIYNADHYSVTSLIQDYQTLSGDEPYKRLPQILFNSRFENNSNALNYNIESEIVNFQHKDKNKIIGQRLYVSPYLSYPVVSDAGFLTPKISVNHIEYNLDHLAQITDPASPSVTVPVFSMDMGLFFERDSSFNDTAYLHTLEPHLFFVYAPRKDQDTLPVFDTGLTTFSETLLFSENRFSGKDRIGDTNELTASVKTRFYQQDSGIEVFNATVGQIFYFTDRYVTLPGSPVETASRSNYIVSARFQPSSNWRISNDLQWNPETHHNEVINTSLQYDTNDGSVFNAGYRFRREVVGGTEELRNTIFSFSWKVNQNWKLYGGYQYDINNNHRLENFVGFRYDDCCWGIRLITRDRFDELNSNVPQYEKAIFLEIELKGFSTLGRRKDINSLLDHGILGYTE